MSYRDGGGTFHLVVGLADAVPGDVPPIMRFVGQHGVALPLWEDRCTDELAVLKGARLDWKAERRHVLVAESQAQSDVTEVAGYRALCGRTRAR